MGSDHNSLTRRSKTGKDTAHAAIITIVGSDVRTQGSRVFHEPVDGMLGMCQGSRFPPKRETAVARKMEK